MQNFGETPRVAMLSFSNFGSVRHPHADKVARAVALLRERDPQLMVDGEMQADTALDEGIQRERYPFSALKGEANVLIFPNLSAGNIAYKLLSHLGGATAIGPILVGMNRPVHVLEQGADVQDIVNMAAVAVMDAQARGRRPPPPACPSPRAAAKPASFNLFRLPMATTTAPVAPTSAATTRARSPRSASPPPATVHWNLVAPALVQAAIRRGEGQLADMGPFVAVTSPHTGRSPNDKFVVREPSSEADVDWGKVNQPMARRTSTRCSPTCGSTSSGLPELFVQDLFCGADPAHRLSVRYVLPNAWHANFVRNMFIRPDDAQLAGFAPNFTVLHAPEFQADPAKHGTRTGTFIVLHLGRAARSSSAAPATPAR